MMPTAEQTLLALAQLDPDYHAFVQQLPDELTATKEPLPDGLAADVVALLKAERPELSKWFEMQSSSPPPTKFVAEAVTEMGRVLCAVIFLLGIHIKIEGKNFSIIYDPTNGELRKKVMETLGAIFKSKK